MVELADKYPEKLCGAAPTLLNAFNQLNSENKLLAANGSWYRVVEKNEESVKTADFEFLTIDKSNKPIQFNLSWDGKWKVEQKDITDEMEGTMEEEAAFLGKAEKKLKTEAEVLKTAEGKLLPLRQKSPHLRIDLISFNAFDSDYSSDDEIVPTWRVSAKNWPIISYLKSNERSRSVEVVIDGRDGKVLAFNSD